MNGIVAPLPPEIAAFALPAVSSRRRPAGSAPGDRADLRLTFDTSDPFSIGSHSRHNER